VDLARKFVERDQLTNVVRAAFGSVRRLDTVDRLQGGSKKGVYRLILDDESTAILYVWYAAENFWPAPQDGLGEDPSNPFSDASGVDLFEASRACLDSIGVRTPQVYLLDRSGSHYPADIAIVEDIRGGTLEDRLQHDPLVAEPTMAGLRDTLQAMQQHRGRSLGKIALVSSGDAPQDRSCEQVVLDRALHHLAEAASRDERVAEVHEQLEETVHELAGAVLPREEYTLIHGELGPDHVIVDELGDPVIIDIEGTMFFDVEWEHVFLQLRFGKYYRWLRADDLDDRRLRFYALALNLSLVAGPLRLLNGDSPARDLMREIAESALARVLTFLP
jgi:hypothetical protein